MYKRQIRDCVSNEFTCCDLVIAYLGSVTALSANLAVVTPASLRLTLGVDGVVVSTLIGAVPTTLVRLPTVGLLRMNASLAESVTFQSDCTLASPVPVVPATTKSNHSASDGGAVVSLAVRSFFAM